MTHRLYRHLVLVMMSLLAMNTWSAEAMSTNLTRPLRELPPNARLALCGDSITEQMRYTTYVTAYLLACAGRTDVSVFQFGWGGENADQFKNRIARGDLDAFKPTAVSIAYGANDGGGQAWQDWMEPMWRGRLTSVVTTVRERYPALHGATVVCSPTWFQSDPSGSNRAHIDGTNQTLARFRTIGLEIAREQGAAFADLQQRLRSTGEAAVAEHGPTYRFAGQDGVHPGPNGHLVLATEVLRALGCRGDIATITIPANGSATVSDGQTLVSNADGRLTLTSSRYPFCVAYDHSTAPDAMATILPYLPFMQELNRFVVVAQIDVPAADLTWGEETHRFTKEQLAAGINLPEHFRQTPFDAAFANLMKAIIAQQERERSMIKAAGDATAPKAGWTAADVSARDALDTATHSAVVPVTYVLAITPQR